MFKNGNVDAKKQADRPTQKRPKPHSYAARDEAKISVFTQ
jgi:hypothetical protein